jgi:hypothetical protein
MLRLQHCYKAFCRNVGMADAVEIERGHDRIG